jgi:CheY-like chemotaxis protein
MSSRTILVVEDGDDDLFFLKRALKNAAITDELRVATNGQQAIDYLGGQQDYADRAKSPLPWMIFLDLKLPYKSGFEVLEWVRHQPQLESIKVIILTSSPEHRDIDRATQLGAHGYLVKPPKAEMLKELWKNLEQAV